MEAKVNKRNKHSDIIAKILGVFFLLVAFAAIILSPTVLGVLLSPDGKIGSPSLIIEINFFRFLTLAVASTLYFFRQKIVVFLISQPQLLATALAIGCIVGLIGLIELSLAVGKRASKITIVVESIDNNQTPTLVDSDLGYRPLPSSKIRVTKKNGDQILYNALYSHDQHSRRVVPLSLNEPDEKEIAIFFGDSFTYGEGVNDDETMPYFYSKNSGVYQSFNYGFSGYGPQNMLAMLENESYLAPVVEKIQQKNAKSCPVMIYTFIDHHIMRALGSFSVMTYGQDLPFYQLDGSDLKRSGSFSTDRKFTTKVLRLFSHSNILKLLNVEYPLRLNEASLDTTARIIAKSRDIATHKLNSPNFFVVLYPGTTLANLIKPKLEELNIRVLDYTGQDSGFNMDLMTIPVDRHPNGAGHQHIARLLARDIGKASCKDSISASN